VVLHKWINSEDSVDDLKIQRLQRALKMLLKTCKYPTILRDKEWLSPCQYEQIANLG